MGYLMEQQNTEFKILAANKALALEAVKKLVGCETITDSTGRHFSWVDSGTFLRADTLEEALKAWRWGTETNNDGNIVNIGFTGQKLGDDAMLFNAIAPFVENGSYIQMIGEDDTIWRWTFENGQMEEKTGEVSFGDETFTMLLIEHNDDITASIHRSPHSAKDALFGYVQANWEQEVGDEAMPEDFSEAIRTYFEVSEEGYKIVEDAHVYP